MTLAAVVLGVLLALVGKVLLFAVIGVIAVIALVVWLVAKVL